MKNENRASNVEIRRSQTWLMGFGCTQCVQNINTSVDQSAYVHQMCPQHKCARKATQLELHTPAEVHHRLQGEDFWEKIGCLVIHLPSSYKWFPWNPEWMHTGVVLVPVYAGLQEYMQIRVCFVQRQESAWCSNEALHNRILSCSDSTSVCTWSKGALCISAFGHSVFLIRAVLLLGNQTW